MSVRGGCISGLACLLTLLSASAAAEVGLTFGLYASDKPSAMVRQFRPFLDVLESEVSDILGEKVEIKLKIANSYEAGRKNLSVGKVDFTRFGAASYVLVKDAAPEVSILAVESKKGKKVFNGVIAVHAESEIRNIADLKGKKFAFGSETSTIGRYLSQFYLMEQGVRAKDLSSFEYLGRHDTVGSMVAIGKFDAGALKEGTFKKLVKKLEEDLQK